MTVPTWLRCHRILHPPQRLAVLQCRWHRNIATINLPRFGQTLEQLRDVQRRRRLVDEQVALMVVVKIHELLISHKLRCIAANFLIL